MKKSMTISLIAVSVVVAAFASCKKEECHECHYDKNGTEVELGVKCDDEIESLESNGYTENGVNYTVHCAEH